MTTSDAVTDVKLNIFFILFCLSGSSWEDYILDSSVDLCVSAEGLRVERTQLVCSRNISQEGDTGHTAASVLRGWGEADPAHRLPGPPSANLERGATVAARPKASDAPQLLRLCGAGAKNIII
jgi:hypothetical protein